MYYFLNLIYFIDLFKKKTNKIKLKSLNMNLLQFAYNSLFAPSCFIYTNTSSE